MDQEIYHKIFSLQEAIGLKKKEKMVPWSCMMETVSAMYLIIYIIFDYYFYMFDLYFTSLAIINHSIFSVELNVVLFIYKNSLIISKFTNNFLVNVFV